MKKAGMMIGLVAAGVLMSGWSWAAGEAKVTGLTGEAYLVSKAGIQRTKEGSPCEAGDMLVTRQGCQLDLMVNGQAGCRLLPNTTMAIASVRPNKMKLLVAEGNVVLNIKKLAPGTEFNLDTPTSVAAVRGTQFWGRVSGGEGAAVSTFAVKEGAVQITQKESGQTVLINAGQAVDLSAATTTPQPRPATPAEMAAMKAADEIAGKM